MNALALEPGARIGHLVLLERTSGPDGTYHRIWRVRCDCGVVFDRRAEHLLRRRPMCRRCSARELSAQRPPQPGRLRLEQVVGRVAEPVCQLCYELTHRLEPGTSCPRCGLRARPEQAVTVGECMRSSAGRWEGCAA